MTIIYKEVRYGNKKDEGHCQEEGRTRPMA